MSATVRRLACGGAVVILLLAVWAGGGAPEPAPASRTPRSTAAVRRSPTAFPTWTAEPVTPTATATATATPTPIIYAIQQGDTLLDVANRFGVSAAEIQEVNGIADPRSLQIGQQLVIPASSGDAAFSTPTATPMPMHPGAITHNRTTTGDVVVVGEVVNDSASGVEEVTVLIELADSNGAVVASGEAAVLSDVIGVKGSAPFAVTIAQAPAYTEVRCRVLRAMPEVPERAVNRDLRVAEVAGRSGLRPYLRGQWQGPQHRRLARSRCLRGGYPLWARRSGARRHAPPDRERRGGGQPRAV